MDSSILNDLKNRKSYLLSLVITAIFMALGINLVSSWISDSNHPSTSLLISGIVAILTSMFAAYLSARPPQYETRFQTGTFVVPSSKSPDRIEIVAFRHFQWANPQWLDDWDGHSTLLTALPARFTLDHQDRIVATNLVSHLLVCKLCQESDKWHVINRQSKAEKLSAPGMKRILITPVPIRRHSPRLASEHIYDLELRSWIGRCAIVVQPVLETITEVKISPVLAHVAQSPSSIVNGSTVFAIQAEVKCLMRLSLLGYIFNRAESLSQWFFDMVAALKKDCYYEGNMHRLEQLVLFELFRMTVPDIPPIRPIPLQKGKPTSGP